MSDHLPTPTEIRAALDAVRDREESASDSSISSEVSRSEVEPPAPVPVEETKDGGREVARIGDEHITIAAFPDEMDPHERIRLREKCMRGHGEPADELVVLVPPGRWREVRELIWNALGSRPVAPENVGPHGAQDGDYLRRRYGSL